MRAMLISVLMAFAAVPAFGQEAPAVNPDEADISITATVRAREIRFETAPEIRIEFSGQPERLTDSQTERTNLPNPVQPGVYRDVVVRWTLVSLFTDPLGQALETPASGEARPPLAPSEPQGKIN